MWARHSRELKGSLLHLHLVTRASPVQGLDGRVHPRDAARGREPGQDHDGAAAQRLQGHRRAHGLARAHVPSLFYSKVAYE